MVIHTPLQRGKAFEEAVTREAMRAEEVWRSPWLDGNEEQA